MLNVSGCRADLCSTSLETLKKIFMDAYLRDFCFEGYYKKTKGALNIG